MPFPAVNVDYTDKDFTSLRARLQALIKSVFPQWTDFNVATFGNILIDGFAFIGDVLGFYQDAQAREAFIVTATQRKSLLNLAALVGFVPPGATAAQVEVVLSIPSSAVGSVPILNGTVIKTVDAVNPVRFQVLNPNGSGYAITPGQSSVVVSAEHSTSAEDNFTSSGLANQSFQLSTSPFLDDTLVVTAADGTYVQQRNLLNSGPSDKHFTILVDQRDRARITFGNGVNGSIPVGNIVANYRVGGGPDGNVAKETLSVVEGDFTDSLGNVVQLSAINPEPASGGAPRMSNELIKRSAPEQLRAPVNTTAYEDFAINVLRLPQVARVLFLTRNQDPAVPENTGILFPVPYGGGTPTQALKDLVKEQVTTVYPCQTTFNVLVQNPVFRTINVEVLAEPMSSDAKVVALMKQSITTALQAFFALTTTTESGDEVPNDSIDFGANLRGPDLQSSSALAWSDVFNAVRDASYVRKVDPTYGVLLNGERADFVLALREFPVLGNIVIRNALTGEQV